MADLSAKRWSKTVLIYTAFSLLPIYWLVVLSLQPNAASERSSSAQSSRTLTHSCR